MSNSWVWVSESVVLSIHEAQLAEHGGLTGIRDAGLLGSALARPQNQEAYGADPGPGELATAYAFGIVQNHPFLDGNKRTAFVTMELFLNLNGYLLNDDDPSCISNMQALAAGTLSERDFAKWVSASLIARATRDEAPTQ